MAYERIAHDAMCRGFVCCIIMTAVLSGLVGHASTS
jgi:hypothetical protein